MFQMFPSEPANSDTIGPAMPFFVQNGCECIKHINVHNKAVREHGVLSSYNMTIKSREVPDLGDGAIHVGEEVIVILLYVEGEDLCHGKRHELSSS